MKDGRCHVAILDDGISKSYTQSPSFYCMVDLKNNEEILASDISHGTIVFEIISHYYSRCLISCIRIIDNDGKCTTDDLANAIRWCLDNDVDIIHMSIGTTQTYNIEQVLKLIHIADEKGIIMVASQSNTSVFTFPASLPEVIGVRHSDEFLPTKYVLRLNSWDGIDILTSSRHSIRVNGEKLVLSASNSFASPFITSLIAKLVNEKGIGKRNEIISELLVDAQRVSTRMALNKSGYKIKECEDYIYSKIINIYGNIHTPILSITSNYYDVRIVMKKIESEFCKHYYNTYVITGVYKNINWDKYFRFLELKYNVDIIIGQQIETYDLQLVFNENTIDLISKEIVIRKNPYGNFEEIFDSIIKMLSE